MSATDPKLGRFNPLRGDPIQCGPVPTLYHAESQHNSMVCRLGLAERGCEWRSRLVDIHTMCEQVGFRAAQLVPHVAFCTHKQCWGLLGIVGCLAVEMFRLGRDRRVQRPCLARSISCVWV